MNLPSVDKLEAEIDKLELEKEAFGQRYLKDESAVFQYNAWDNVDWPEEEEKRASEIVKNQMSTAVKNADHLEHSADKYWDQFYTKHSNRFFMNRNWINREFPELLERCSKGEKVRALDVGCGVGNTTFPLLDAAGNNFFMYCCDFSPTAIEMVYANENFCAAHCKPFIWDITGDLTLEIEPNSLDFILCIYVLSALPPDKHRKTIENLSSLLAPGGLLIIKDYARYDLTQLRFKANRFIRDNFYCRGDSTLVYFFSSEELDDLLTSFCLSKLQNCIDKRLIVNRAKQIKMYRRWIQCKYYKALM